MSFLGLCIFINIVLGNEYINTPHGKRLKKCVIKHDISPVIIDEVNNGVNVYYPKTNQHKFFKKDMDCVNEAKNIFNNISNVQIWQNNAFDSNTPALGTFTSLYDLPNETPTNDGQLLYYFIGMVNYGSPLGETIVQPVVQYDTSGQYPKGWSMESWNCCPGGQSHEANVIQLPTDAVNIPNSMIADGNNVNISMSYNGVSSTLIVRQSGRTFKYVDATLEEYNVKSCNAFNSKPFIFKNMSVIDLNGNSYAPKWVINENMGINCDGKVIKYDDYNIGITGTNN